MELEIGKCFTCLKRNPIVSSNTKRAFVELLKEHYLNRNILDEAKFSKCLNMHNICVRCANEMKQCTDIRRTLMKQIDCNGARNKSKNNKKGDEQCSVCKNDEFLIDIIKSKMRIEDVEKFLNDLNINWMPKWLCLQCYATVLHWNEMVNAITTLLNIDKAAPTTTTTTTTKIPAKCNKQNFSPKLRFPMKQQKRNSRFSVKQEHDAELKVYGTCNDLMRHLCTVHDLLANDDIQLNDNILSEQMMHSIAYICCGSSTKNKTSRKKSTYKEELIVVSSDNDDDDSDNDFSPPSTTGRRSTRTRKLTKAGMMIEMNKKRTRKFTGGNKKMMKKKKKNNLIKIKLPQNRTPRYSLRETNKSEKKYNKNNVKKLVEKQKNNNNTEKIEKKGRKLNYDCNSSSSKKLKLQIASDDDEFDEKESEEDNENEEKLTKETNNSSCSSSSNSNSNNSSSDDDNNDKENTEQDEKKEKLIDEEVVEKNETEQKEDPTNEELKHSSNNEDEELKKGSQSEEILLNEEEKEKEVEEEEEQSNKNENPVENNDQKEKEEDDDDDDEVTIINVSKQVNETEDNNEKSTVMNVDDENAIVPDETKTNGENLNEIKENDGANEKLLSSQQDIIEHIFGV